MGKGKRKGQYGTGPGPDDSLNWLIRVVGSSMSTSMFESVLVFSSNETFLALELSRDKDS